MDPPDLSIIEASRRELAEGVALASPEEEAQMTSVALAAVWAFGFGGVKFFFFFYYYYFF